MLASAGMSVAILRAEAAAWAFEMKWDGIRALTVSEPGQGVRLYTRNGNDVTAAYPELAVLGSFLAGRAAVLDGEIVALDGRGRPDFGLLQSRMQLSRPADVERVRGRVGVHYFLFDILELDGRSVLDEPYDRRRRLLEELFPAAAGPVQVPPAFLPADSEPPTATRTSPVDDALASSRALGLEGVLAKRRDSRYLPGRRSSAWAKLKDFRTQEVVVGGWRPGRGRRSGGVGSLLLGIPGLDGLEYVGRVGTGFGEKELTALVPRFRQLERATSPFRDVPTPDAADAHWVTPSLVGEVEFADWTASGRLRQPAWRGWRTDKRPDEVLREE